MSDMSKSTLQAASPYNASITREQFLFYEVRTTAKLLHEGCNAEEVVERIISDKDVYKRQSVVIPSYGC